MKAITNSTLVFWLSCYIAGILAFISSWNLVLVIFSLLVFVIGVIPIKRTVNYQFYLIFAPLFFLTGFLSMEGYFPNENDSLIKGENFYTGKVVQQISADKTWNSYLVKLKSGRDKDKKWQSTSEKVLLLIENSENQPALNDLILFQTKFNKIELKGNPGEFNAKTYWLSKGVRFQCFVGSDQFSLIEIDQMGWFDKILVKSRAYSEKVLDKWVGASDAPLIKAILLGDKSDLDVDVKRAFINTGAMHMLAVSGLHVGIIVMLLGLMFKYLFAFRGKNTAFIIMILLLWFYAFLTGFSASVVRAVVMFTILILAQLLRRGYQPINSLSIAAFVVLLVDPLAIFDIGFQLSFLAMVGIFSVFPILENGFVFKNKLLDIIWKGTAIGLAAQVFTIPISIYYFKQFPNYFFLSNLGIMLFSGVMLALAIGLLMVGKIAFLSMPIGWLLAISCSLFVGFISYIEMIPGAVAVGFNPTLSWVLLMYVFVLAALYWAEHKKWIWIVLFLLPLFTWLQFDRLMNMTTKEWVVFNANNPVVLFNNGKHQLCLYGGNERGKKNALRLTQDYQKIHPGEIEFIPFTEGKYTLFPTVNTTFKIKSENGLITVKTPKNEYVLLLTDRVTSDQINSKSKVISLVPSYTKNVFHDLKKGAFQQKLTY